MSVKSLLALVSVRDTCLIYMDINTHTSVREDRATSDLDMTSWIRGRKSMGFIGAAKYYPTKRNREDGEKAPVGEKVIKKEKESS